MFNVFHVALSIAQEARINHTQVANCWTFIGHSCACGQGQFFFISQKMTGEWQGLWSLRWVLPLAWLASREKKQ
jgi:hypothetical protein